MKVKHYYNFNDFDFEELNETNWDLIRTNNVPGPFSIERDIDEYEKNCNNSPDYKQAAKLICEIIGDYKNEGKRLVSLGCGKGIIEWHIKETLPNLYLKCTDYTIEGLELLKKVFVKCNEFSVFDLLREEDYKILKADDIILMYRVSTEFTSKQWGKIFDKLFDRGVENIIFVPTEIMTLRIAVNEKKRQILNLIKRKKNTFCGWLYSYGEYLKMFKGEDNNEKYEIVKEKRMNDTIIFVLKRRSCSF